MDFALLPPEVISGWLYSGPGTQPLHDAATAWDGLATELSSAADNYRAIITGLANEPWQGPAAASMTAAATPYLTWMSGTAEQARHTAAAARAAAAAYQAAHAGVVPPAAITANRLELQHLLATNVIGQNLPGITANQAAYAAMQAQNAAVMHGYAAESSTAATLSPFSAPAQDTDPTGQAKQAAAVAQASAASGSSQAQNLLASLAGANPLSNGLAEINQFLSTNPLYLAAGPAIQSFGGLLSVVGAPMFMGISPIFYLIPAIFSWFPAIVGGTPLAFTISDVAPTGGGALGGSTLVGASSAAGEVSAGLGRAAGVGGLSVPQTWQTPVKLASLASALPAGAGMGGLHGLPPIASVVNAPRGNDNNPRNALRSKLVGDLGRPGAPGERAGTPDLVNPLSEKERAELDGLRAELAELVMEQDAVTRLMNQAFKA